MTKRTISESSQSWQTHKLLTFIILSKMNVAVGTTVKIAEGGGGILSQSPHPIFFAHQTVCLKCDTIKLFIKVWAVYPSLKIEQGGNFQMGSLSYHFLLIRLPPIAKIPAIETVFHIDIKITLYEVMQ